MCVVRTYKGTTLEGRNGRTSRSQRQGSFLDNKTGRNGNYLIKRQILRIRDSRYVKKSRRKEQGQVKRHMKLP